MFFKTIVIPIGGKLDTSLLEKLDTFHEIWLQYMNQLRALSILDYFWLPNDIYIQFLWRMFL